MCFQTGPLHVGRCSDPIKVKDRARARVRVRVRTFVCWKMVRSVSQGLRSAFLGALPGRIRLRVRVRLSWEPSQVESASELKASEN